MNDMTEAKIKQAAKAAHEFVRRVALYFARYNEDSIMVGKESGALRRQSMELTRALAEMRRK
jgi:hypothetical protein